MAELSIVTRMAQFIEHVVHTTGGPPARIVVSEAQIRELARETGTSIKDIQQQTFSFWGIPLVVDYRSSKDGQTTIETH